MNYIITVLKTRKFTDEAVLTETLAPIFETLKRLEKRVLTLEAVITGKSGTNSISSKAEEVTVPSSERSLKPRREERVAREERASHREDKPRRPKAKDLLSALE